MKVDRRKKYYLVLDVESANTLQQPLVYDIGYSVVDKKGNIYYSKSHAITDLFFDEKKIFNNDELMNSAYYSKKLPQYFEQKGKWKFNPFLKVRKDILKIMKEFNINTVCAYNCSFDRNALNTTLRYITKSKLKWFFPYGTEFQCIWNMACQVICTQKRYIEMAIENNWFTKSGNMLTNAEKVWSYLINDKDFEEEHTGLEDVKIEVQIMARCLAQHKPMKTNIYRACWRIPQKKVREVRKFLI